MNLFSLPLFMHKYCTKIVFCLLALMHFNATAQNSSFSFVYEGPSQIIVGPDCEAELQWGHPNTPMAFSNIPGGEITSFEILSISGGYSIGDLVPPGELVQVLYQAFDNMNNSAVFGFNIVFVDDIPPSFDEETLPPDIEIACIGDIPNPAMVTGFDNCMGPEYQFMITLTEEMNLDGCMGGTITRTWEADDDLGNQSVYTQTITVLADTTDPVFVFEPMDGSGACDDAMNLYTQWLNDQRANTQADDGGCSEVAVTDNAPDASVLVGFCGDVPVQFTAADECGNNVTITATFSIQNEVPPTIETQASDATADCASGNPESVFQAWINNQGGASAFDDCGSVSWTTNPPNPTLGDSCSNMLTIDFIADDGCGNTSSTTATFMAIDTTAPTINNESQPRIINCDIDDVTFELITWLKNAGNVSAQDICTGQDNLTLMYQIGDNLLDTLGVLSALADSLAGGCMDGVTINGLLFNNVAARIDLNFTFIDACGNMAFEPGVFAVIDNTPPSIDSLPQNMTVVCDTALNLQNKFFNWYGSAGNAIATDGCGTVFWNGFPNSLNALNELTAALDTSCAEGVSVEVGFFAMDFCGNSSDTVMASFTVIDTVPPSITIASDTLILSCVEMGNIPFPEVLDYCDSNPNITFDDMVMGEGCGQIIDRIWMAIDGCGNASNASQVIMFTDTTSPIEIFCPDTISAEILMDTCAGMFTIQLPEIEHDCATNDSITIQYQIDDMPIVDISMNDSIEIILSSGTHLIQWIVSDCQMNTATCETILIVNNETEVEIICPPSQLLMYLTNDSCNLDISLPLPEIEMSGCVAEVNGYIKIVGATVVDSFPINLNGSDPIFNFEEGSSLVEYFLVSQNGNRDTCSLNVTLLDTIAPTAICNSIAITTFPSTQIVDTISVDQIDNGSFDNCAINEITIDSSSIDCLIGDTVIKVTLIVTDGAGNSSSCVSNVTVTSISLVPSFSIDICNPDTLFLFSNLDIPAGVNVTYDWKGPNGFGSTEVNPVIELLGDSLNGTYILTITGEGGCSATGEIEVVIGTLEDPGLEINNAEFCTGDSIVLISQNYPGMVNYRWVILQNDSIIIDTLTSASSFILIASDNGKFNAFVIAQAAGCMSNSSDTVMFTINVIPQINIPFDSLSICQGDTVILMVDVLIEDITMEDVTMENVQYIWSGPDGFSSNEVSPKVIISSESKAGKYYVQVFNNTCASNIDSVEVVILPQAETPKIQGDAFYCSGATLTLVPVVNDFSISSTYEWISPQGMIITPANDTLQIASINNSHAGIWRVVRITDVCPSDTSDGFDVNLVIAEDITIENEGPYCMEDNVTLSVSSNITDATFEWSGPDDFQSNESSPILDSVIQGSYFVTITTKEGCVIQDSTEIMVAIVPQFVNISAAFETCVSGEDPGKLTASFSGSGFGVIYEWISPDNDTTYITSLTIDSLSEADNGIYKLNLYLNGCMAEPAFYEVDVIQRPDGPLIESPLMLCAGDSLIVHSNAEQNDSTTYVWSTPNGEIITTENSLEIANTDPDNAGLYGLVIVQGICTSEISNLLDIDVQSALAAPAISGPNKICAGDSLILSITGGSMDGVTYNWTGPANFSSTSNEPIIFPATNLSTGNYSVFAQVGDCISETSNSFFVEVTARPDAPTVEAFAGGVCLDDLTPITICLDENSTIQGATYYWSNGDNGTELGITTGRCFMVSDFDSFTEGENSFLVSAEVDGCRSLTSAAISIPMFNFPEEIAETDDELFICFGDEPIINATEPLVSNGMWSSFDGGIIFDAPENSSTLVQGLVEGENQLIWTLSYEACLNYSSDTAIVVVEPFPILTMDTIFVDFGRSSNFNTTINDQIPEGFTLTIVENPRRGNTLHQGNGNFVYTPNIGYVGEDKFIYRICSNECPGQCDETIVLLKVGDENDCFVPTLFTPNEDGINDVWIIPCLEADRLPNNRVVVYNQWGDSVFESTTYRNNWDGTRKGKDLPVGTYYYVVDFGDGSDIRKGFIILER